MAEEVKQQLGNNVCPSSQKWFEENTSNSGDPLTRKGEGDPERSLIRGTCNDYYVGAKRRRNGVDLNNKVVG